MHTVSSLINWLFTSTLAYLNNKFLSATCTLFTTAVKTALTLISRIYFVKLLLFSLLEILSKNEILRFYQVFVSKKNYFISTRHLCYQERYLNRKKKKPPRAYEMLLPLISVAFLSQKTEDQIFSQWHFILVNRLLCKFFYRKVAESLVSF